MLVVWERRFLLCFEWMLREVPNPEETLGLFVHLAIVGELPLPMGTLSLLVNVAIVGGKKDLAMASKSLTMRVKVV